MESHSDEYPALTAKTVDALFQLAGAGADAGFQLCSGAIEIAATGTEGLAVRYALACPRQPAEEVSCSIRLAWAKSRNGSRRPRLVCPHCGRRTAVLRLTWQGAACQECINAGIVSPSRCRAERMYPRLAPEDGNPLRPAWLASASRKDEDALVPFAQAVRLAAAYAEKRLARRSSGLTGAGQGQAV